MILSESPSLNNILDTGTLSCNPTHINKIARVENITHSLQYGVGGGGHISGGGYKRRVSLSMEYVILSTTLTEVYYDITDKVTIPTALFIH